MTIAAYGLLLEKYILTAY